MLNVSRTEYLIPGEAGCFNKMERREIALDRIRGWCKVFWKRIYFFAPILIIVFFICGFLNEYFALTKLTPERVDMLYGTLTEEMIREFSLYSGLIWAGLYSSLVVYIILLITLLISEKSKSRLIGIIFLVISVLMVTGYFFFITNLHIPF